MEKRRRNLLAVIAAIIIIFAAYQLLQLLPAERSFEQGFNRISSYFTAEGLTMDLVAAEELVSFGDEGLTEQISKQQSDSIKGKLAAFENELADYEQTGDANRLRGAVDIFYRHLVLNDEKREAFSDIGGLADVDCSNLEKLKGLRDKEAEIYDDTLSLDADELAYEVDYEAEPLVYLDSEKEGQVKEALDFVYQSSWVYCTYEGEGA